MKKIDSRPISDLTTDMGVVLLIGRNPAQGSQTRAALGLRDKSGAYVTVDGDAFALHGNDAVAFIQVPYDEGAALSWDAPETPADIAELFAQVKGIARDMPKSIGPDLTIRTIDSVLGDRSRLLYINNPMMDALIEIGDAVTEVAASELSATKAIDQINEILRNVENRVRRAQSLTIRRQFADHSISASAQIATFRQIALSADALGYEETQRLLNTFGASIDMDLSSGSEANRSLVHKLRKAVRNRSYNSGRHTVSQVLRMIDNA
jgi:hypothetical protein